MAGTDSEDGAGAGVVAGKEAQGIATTESHGGVFGELTTEQLEMERCGLVSPLPEEGDQLSEGEDVGIFSVSGGEERGNVVPQDRHAAIRVQLTVNDDSGENLVCVEEEQASLNDGGMCVGAALAEVGCEPVVVSGGGNHDGGVTGADGAADGLAEAVEQR